VIYVFDSGPLIVLFRHYYPERFPSLWQRFDPAIAKGTIVSVREVSREIEGADDRLSAWAKRSREVFHSPSPEELRFVAKIFTVSHFQTLVRKQERLQGKPVADPFVIAKAATTDEACVVTQELMRLNAAGIPNVCDHFKIPWTSLEGFMEREDWTF
jgi:hypothetical protein